MRLAKTAGSSRIVLRRRPVEIGNLTQRVAEMTREFDTEYSAATARAVLNRANSGFPTACRKSDRPRILRAVLNTRRLDFDACGRGQGNRAAAWTVLIQQMRELRLM
jgi:hypothetical protein